jgi:hypothetical protein
VTPVKNFVSCAYEVLGARSGTEARDVVDVFAAPAPVAPIRPNEVTTTMASRTGKTASTRREGVVTAATPPVWHTTSRRLITT